MLRATPLSWLSWSYELADDSGPVAVIEHSWFRERALLVVGGERLRLERERWMSGRFLLRRDGAVLARAEKPSLLRRRFVVTAGARRLVLAAKSAFGREFTLHEGSRAVGRVRPLGIFSRRAEADLPDDLDLRVRVFLFALVTLSWKRSANSSS